jgi:hypothetical protein
MRPTVRASLCESIRCCGSLPRQSWAIGLAINDQRVCLVSPSRRASSVARPIVVRARLDAGHDRQVLPHTPRRPGRASSGELVGANSWLVLLAARGCSWGSARMTRDPSEERVGDAAHWPGRAAPCTFLACVCSAPPRQADRQAGRCCPAAGSLLPCKPAVPSPHARCPPDLRGPALLLLFFCSTVFTVFWSL